jgi:hypothetical protein
MNATNVKSQNGRGWIRLVMSALMLVVGLLALRPKAAQAHCDAVNGPVVTAAKAALKARDVTLILPYAPASAEAELAAAFNHTLQVRTLGRDARELADRFFFETAVRLHRAGEGAAYTGLKEETDFGPALEAADAALVSGDAAEVTALLEEAVRAGVAEKFAAVEAARAHAAEIGTVKANRERAEAELLFEKYVFALHGAATAVDLHGEGEVAPAEAVAAGHSH